MNLQIRYTYIHVHMHTCINICMNAYHTSRSVRRVESLGKSFTRSGLWRLGVKLGHRIRAVSEAPLFSSGLKRRYRNSLNE